MGKLTAISLLGALLHLAGVGCVDDDDEGRVKEIHHYHYIYLPPPTEEPTPMPTRAPPYTARTASGALIASGALNSPTPTMLEALGKSGKHNPGIYTGPPDTRGRWSRVSRDNAPDMDRFCRDFHWNSDWTECQER